VRSEQSCVRSRPKCGRGPCQRPPPGGRGEIPNQLTKCPTECPRNWLGARQQTHKECEKTTIARWDSDVSYWQDSYIQPDAPLSRRRSQTVAPFSASHSSCGAERWSMAPPSVLFGLTSAFRVDAGDLELQRPFGFPTCSMAGPPSGVQMFSALSDIFLINQSAPPISGPASWLMASVRALTDVRQVSKHMFSGVHIVLPHRSRTLCRKCASPDAPVSFPP